jgi:hypothetical protein
MPVDDQPGERRLYSISAQYPARMAAMRSFSTLHDGLMARAHRHECNPVVDNTARDSDGRISVEKPHKQNNGLPPAAMARLIISV